MPAAHSQQITVDADAIEPGDRTTRDGKTRYVLKHHHRGRIYWRTQTRGARSANIVIFKTQQQIAVWRPNTPLT